MNETVNFTIFFKCFDHPYSIYIDDHPVNSNIKTVENISEDRFLLNLEQGKHRLSINFENKFILYNIFLNRFKCNTNNLLIRKSKFTAVGKDIKLSNTLPLIFNESGRYEFDFEIPFAYWILDEI